VRYVLLVLAATLVVAASTACGGDGDDPVAATTVSIDPSRQRPEPPADQSRWAQEVDSACKEWQDRIDAVAPPEDAESLEAWVAETLPLLRGQIEAVEAVKPSSKKEEEARAGLFLQGLTGVERALTRYLNAIRKGDTEAMETALAAANEAGSQTRGYAISLDVTQCGGYSSG
jgi:hypothetical protein